MALDTLPPHRRFVWEVGPLYILVHSFPSFPFKVIDVSGDFASTLNCVPCFKASPSGISVFFLSYGVDRELTSCCSSPDLDMMTSSF